MYELDYCKLMVVLFDDLSLKDECVPILQELDLVYVTYIVSGSKGLRQLG